MDPITIAMGLAQFAPGIIKLLTGSNKAEDVAKDVVNIARTVTGHPVDNDALRAIQVDPAKALEFQQAMAVQQADLEKAYLADIKSARDRDTEYVKAGVINYRANALAIAAAIIVLLCLVTTVWATNMDDFAKATITLICGRALGWVEQVFSFEFGTTRTNKTKDETINNLTKP